MLDWHTQVIGPFHWQVQSLWRDHLLDASGLRLDSFRTQGQLQTLKDSPHRTIYRVNLPVGSVYIKHYPVDDVRSFLRQLVRVPKARGEFDRAIELARRGIPTFEPLGVGEGPHGESYLISRTLENALPLQAFIEHAIPTLGRAEQITTRFHLAEQLARLMACMHKSGVLHRDLHAGNILVQAGDDLSCRLFLIDLHTVRIGAPLTFEQSRENLVILNRWFAQRSSRADRRRFWRHYSETLELSNPHDLARDLEAYTWQSCLAFWRKREKRPLGNNRYFQRLNGASFQAWAVRDLPPALIQELAERPNAPFATSDCRILKSSRSSTVADLTLTTKHEARAVIYKRFMATKWSDPWVHLAKPTPAMRSWINGHRLLESGLPTARPLAVIHRRRFGFVQDCYLITERLVDTVDLQRHIAGLDRLPPWDRRHELHQLVDQVARLIAALHRRHLSHRDLKAANILVGPPRAARAGEIANPGPYQLYLIDLVGVDRWRKLPHARAVQNLARLHVSFHHRRLISNTDKLRFLRAYMAWGLRGKAGWKKLWREIAQATQEKLAQNSRRGRPIS